jgi:hypothetical protein
VTCDVAKLSASRHPQSQPRCPRGCVLYTSPSPGGRKATLPPPLLATYLSTCAPSCAPPLQHPAALLSSTTTPIPAPQVLHPLYRGPQTLLTGQSTPQLLWVKVCISLSPHCPLMGDHWANMALMCNTMGPPSHHPLFRRTPSSMRMTFKPWRVMRIIMISIMVIMINRKGEFCMCLELKAKGRM